MRFNQYGKNIILEVIIVLDIFIVEQQFDIKT